MEREFLGADGLQAMDEASVEAQPEYACALIEDHRGLLLELREPGAAQAGGHLTCFGGRCEPGETGPEALVRELEEELGWLPAWQRPACDLVAGRRFIARFYRAGPAPAVVCCRLPRRRALWVPSAALPGVPLSPWHARVVATLAAGGSVVDLSAQSPAKEPPAR